MNRVITLLLLSLISFNLSLARNKYYLLHSDNLKYWECRIDENTIEGIIFKKDKTYIEYDGVNNFYNDLSQQDAIFKNMYSFRGNRIDFFYDVDRKKVIESWNVLRLTGDTLIIREDNGSVFTFLKAKEQNKQLKLPPQFRNGYRRPRLKDSCQLQIIMNSVFNNDSIICPKPSIGRIIVNCDINKEGNVSSIEIQRATPSTEIYGIFYGVLLNELRKLKFVPAMDVDSGDFFSEKINIPISFDYE